MAIFGLKNKASKTSQVSDNLERFLRFRGRHYKDQRDFPKVRGTSELSPYLALGVISHRQCLQAVMSENGGHLADDHAVAHGLQLAGHDHQPFHRALHLNERIRRPEAC